MLTLNKREIAHTGASNTTTYNIKVYFCMEGGEVTPCPVIAKRTKGYSNDRYVWQIYPVDDHAILWIVGSANPRTGPTPKALKEMGPMENLDIHSKNPGKYLEAAGSGIIKEIFEEVVEEIPGRFCYYPKGARKEDLIIAEDRIWGSAHEWLEWLNNEKGVPIDDGGWVYDKTKTGFMKLTEKPSGGYYASTWISFHDLASVYSWYTNWKRGKEVPELGIKFDKEVEIWKNTFKSGNGWYAFIYGKSRIEGTINGGFSGLIYLEKYEK